MSNPNNSIYKSTGGKNVSRKKLYKLPRKHHGQKGGGFMANISKLFQGGEIPGSPQVDGDGNVVDIENDTNDESQMSTLTPDETTVKTPDETTVKTPDETPDETTVKTPDETTDETPVKTPDGKESNGLFQGFKNTVSESLSNTGEELNKYMSQSSTPVDDSDNESLMEPSSTNIQVPCDELLEENKKLREKINELQEEIKEILKKNINRLESREPSFSQDSSNISPIETNSSSENYMSMDSPEGMSETSSNDNMDISPDPLDKTSVESTSPENSQMEISPEGMSETSPNAMDISSGSLNEESNGSFGNEPFNQTSMDVSTDENVGGTKRRKKKNRKTKRKRNKRVSFQ